MWHSELAKITQRMSDVLSYLRVIINVYRTCLCIIFRLQPRQEKTKTREGLKLFYLGGRSVNVYVSSCKQCDKEGTNMKYKIVIYFAVLCSHNC